MKRLSVVLNSSVMIVMGLIVSRKFVVSCSFLEILSVEMIN